MTNRIYLYFSDHLPESPEWTDENSLLSGSPAACRPSTRKASERIVRVGDHAPGRENLTSYLSRISDPMARSLCEEALQFLNSPAHMHKHFILEFGEIFDLTKGSPADENNSLLADIRDIGAGHDSSPIPVLANVCPGFL